jgi:hypothetical protein
MEKSTEGTGSILFISPHGHAYDLVNAILAVGGNSVSD